MIVSGKELPYPATLAHSSCSISLSLSSIFRCLVARVVAVVSHSSSQWNGPLPGRQLAAILVINTAVRGANTVAAGQNLVASSDLFARIAQ